MTAADSGIERIDLAAEPDFVLGGLELMPSRCKAAANGTEEKVEPRVMQVIVALAKAQERTVSRDELIAACWDGRAVSDDAITRAVVKARQHGRAVHFTIETIPRVGFRLLAGEGAAPSETEPPAAPPPASRIGLAPAAAAALAVAALIAAGLWFGLVDADEPAPAGRLTVAVAAAEETPDLARLARDTRDALVRAFGAAGTPVLAERPAEGAPKAEFALTASPRREGDDYKVRVSIADAGGLVVWSGELKRPASDMQGFGAEVAHEVASLFLCAVEERKAARAALAGDVFSLLAYACETIATGRGLDNVRRLVERAPSVAGAHALLALALADQSTAFDDMKGEAAALTEEARAAAMRALALDPQTARAHVALAVRLDPTLGWAERERHLRRAIEIDPAQLRARVAYATVLRSVGRLKAARDVTRGIEFAVDPRALYPAPQIAFLHAMTGNLEEAYDLLDRMEAVMPEIARGARATAMLWWDDPAKLTADVLRRLPGGNAGCIEAHVASLPRAAKAPVRGLPKECAKVSYDWVMRMLARQGDIDSAYANFPETLPNARAWPMFLFYPEMKAFRRDARFEALAERIGLMSYWRETGTWPDDCAEPDAPAWCGR